jgi:hypothetical protein
MVAVIREPIHPNTAARAGQSPGGRRRRNHWTAEPEHPQRQHSVIAAGATGPRAGWAPALPSPPGRMASTRGSRVRSRLVTGRNGSSARQRPQIPLIARLLVVGACRWPGADGTFLAVSGSAASIAGLDQLNDAAPRADAGPTGCQTVPVDHWVWPLQTDVMPVTQWVEPIQPKTPPNATSTTHCPER